MIESIYAYWDNFRVESDSFKVVFHDQRFANRDLNIVQHFTDGRSHFGAIIFPTNYQPGEQYPLLLWANGLNQADPSVNVADQLITGLAKALSNHFILIPSFRGQALVYRQERYCSDGFFGDAFDGATDDALRLLALARTAYDEINTNQISVIGVSRGGTVALLMAARDPSIARTVAIASPTDFYRQQVYHRYGTQYKYQFLSRTTDIVEMRQKMLKSSPCYFVSHSDNPLLLIHGNNDRVVPLENATQVIELMEGKSNFQSIIHDGGHGFYDWPLVFEWLQGSKG